MTAITPLTVSSLPVQTRCSTIPLLLLLLRDGDVHVDGHGLLMLHHHVLLLLLLDHGLVWLVGLHGSRDYM